jgi:hypothetical protein
MTQAASRRARNYRARQPGLRSCISHNTADDHVVTTSHDVRRPSPRNCEYRPRVSRRSSGPPVAAIRQLSALFAIGAHLSEIRRRGVWAFFNSWNQALIGKPWIRLDDAGTVLAGGSPRSGTTRNRHFQADQAPLIRDAIARGVICDTEHDGIPYVRQADLRRWCEVSGTPWKIPHHAGEDDALSDKASRPASTQAPAHENDDGNADVLDPREQHTLLVLIAAAARAGKLDVTAIERTTDELGVTLSRRTINKHLARIADAIERRKS